MRNTTTSLPKYRCFTGSRPIYFACAFGCDVASAAEDGRLFPPLRGEFEAPVPSFPLSKFLLLASDHNGRSCHAS